MRPLTLADLATRLALNKSSVSLALRDSERISVETRARVQEAARRLGYRPNLAARQLSSSSPRVLALVLPSSFATLANAVVVNTVQNLTRLAGASGMLFSILSSEDLLKAARGESSAPVQADGLFIWGDVPAHAVGLIETLGRPLVVLDPNDVSYASYPGPAIRVDNAGGAAGIVRHLIGQGAQRCLFIQGRADHLGHQQRLTGAREAWLGQRRLERFSSCMLDELTDAHLRAFAAQGNGAQGKGAIFCSNDFCAMQVWHRLHESGIGVPGRVLLAGFDGEAYGRLIGLTTAVFDGDALATAAFNYLVHRMRDPNSELSPMVIPVEIQIGPTTRFTSSRKSRSTKNKEFPCSQPF